MKKLINSGKTVAGQATSNISSHKGSTRTGIVMLAVMGVQWYSTGTAPDPVAISAAIGFILT